MKNFIKNIMLMILLGTLFPAVAFAMVKNIQQVASAKYQEGGRWGGEDTIVLQGNVNLSDRCIIDSIIASDALIPNIFLAISDEQPAHAITRIKKMSGQYSTLDMEILGFEVGNPITITDVIIDKDKNKKFFTYGNKFYDRTKELNDNYLANYISEFPGVKLFDESTNLLQNSLAKQLVALAKKLEALKKNLINLGNALKKLDKSLKMSTKKDLPASLIAALNNIGGTTELTLAVGDREEFPAEVFQLKNLKKLKIIYKDGSSEPTKFKKISGEISQLVSLEELSFDAGLLEELPPEIGQLKKLKKLDIPFNKLKRLPSEIGGLTKLIELDISWSLLGEGLPKELGKLKQLETLNLGFIKSQMVPILCQLTNLEKLEGNFNALSSAELVTLKAHLTKIKKWPK